MKSYIIVSLIPDRGFLCSFHLWTALKLNICLLGMYNKLRRCWLPTSMVKTAKFSPVTTFGAFCHSIFIFQKHFIKINFKKNYEVSAFITKLRFLSWLNSIAWFLTEVFFTYGMSCWEFGSWCFLISIAVQWVQSSAQRLLLKNNWK